VPEPAAAFRRRRLAVAFPIQDPLGWALADVAAKATGRVPCSSGSSL
jgi:hypothetical protein